MRNLHLVVAVILIAIVVYAFRIVLLTIGSVLYVYLLPGIIANKREHPLANKMYLICALSGWLVIPWIAILVMALRGAGPSADSALQASQQLH